MSDDTRRPHDRDHEPAPEEQERSQEELDRTSRSTGGDAEAAASLEEREAVATDEDDLFDTD
jgi:hypothetical protein